MKISDTISARRASNAVGNGGNAPDNSGTISYEQTGEFLSNAVSDRNREVFKKALRISTQARQNSIAQNSAAQAAARRQILPRPAAGASPGTQRRPVTESRAEKRRDSAASISAVMTASAAQGEADDAALLTGMLQEQREVLEQYLKLLDMGEGQRDELLQRHDGSVQDGIEIAGRMQHPEQPKAMQQFRALYHDGQQLEPSSAQQIALALAAKFASKDQFFMALENLRLTTGARMRRVQGQDMGALTCEAYAEGAAFHLIQSTFKIAGRLRAGLDNAVSQIVDPVGDDDQQGRRRRRRRREEDTGEEDEEGGGEEGGGHANSR